MSSNGYAPNYDPRNDSWGSRGPVPADEFQDGRPGGDQRLYDERMNDDYYYDDPSLFGPQQQGYQQDYEYQEDRRGPPPPNSNFDFRRQDQFEPQSYADQQGRRQQPPHMQYDPNFEQPVYPPQDSFDEVPPPGNYYDETRGGYQRQYQQQFQDDFARPGDDNGYEYQQEDGYRYNTPRPPPPPQQFENDKTFDRRQSPQYEDPANNYFEDDQRGGQYDHMQPQGYEQNSRPRPPYRALQRRQQRPPRTDLVRNDNPFEYDPIDERMGRMMSSFPRSGSDIMDQMMSEMMQKTRMMDEMIDRFSSQMNAGMMNARGDQPPLDEFRLMDEALEYLNTDAEVTDVLGNGIQLGPPFSRSSSSEMVNGISTSRLQLGIPIRGSCGEGRAMLFADDEGVTQIGLDVKGHDSLIDVNLDGTRTRSNSKVKDEEVIDATVVDKETD